MVGTPQLVDWNLARATATRLLAPGPAVTRDEALLAVEQLRLFAGKAEEHVREFTGMAPPETASGVPLVKSPVLVVDRPGWVHINIEGFATVLKPLLDKMAERRTSHRSHRKGGTTDGGGSAGAVTSVGSRLTALEVGALLAFMGGKVLGQFEVFGSGDSGKPGTLLLVAPNIVQVERDLDVDPRDFRLWVCLHEETHRTQFAAVPWLRDYVKGEIEEFLVETDIDPKALARRLSQAGGVIIDAIRGRGGVSLLDLIQSPKQREILDRLTAVMSLLEGHADYVMDGVGPKVIPSVADIRAKFQRRRASASGLDAALRRLLGMDAKMRQYRDGEAFVRAVVDEVGMAGFNEVWGSPDTLPTRAELHDPASWVARVHGPRARER